MRTPELKEFIQQHSSLFWYTPQDKKVDVSDEFLVETILNYGTLNEYKDLEKLMGIKEISSVFMGIKGRKKLNYFPEVYNFFYLYFKKHA
ncbi:MAG: hypothetical protein P4L34_13855 [Paludibacter sp.]|nr:hypothetical protein [Paludibacter sp.]